MRLGCQSPPSLLNYAPSIFIFQYHHKIFDSQSVVTGGVDFKFGATHITCHAINRR